MDRRVRWLGRLGGRSLPPGSSDTSAIGEAADGEETSIRLRFTDQAMEGKRRVLVFLLGVPQEDLPSLLDLASRGLDPGRDVAICVVSTLDLAPLRDRGVLFDYLPEAASVTSDTREAYVTYLRRRLGILRLKWDAAAELDLGVPFETFLQANAATIDGDAAG